jgi:quercetin dioxygenase-like cupin family protein
VRDRSLTGLHHSGRDSEAIDHDWGSRTWLANKEITGTEGVTLGRTIILPGRNNPRHRHNTCEEVLYVARGRVRHSVGEETFVLEQGDTLTIPAGVFHHAENIGHDSAEVIVAYSTGQRDFELEQPRRPESPEGLL